VELRLTFKEGGAFDFHTIFEQIKERVYQAYTVARESGQQGAGGADLASVHLEQLPAYEPVSSEPAHRESEGPVIHAPVPIRRGSAAPTTTILGPNQVPPPDGPPPGYEEAEAQAPR